MPVNQAFVNIAAARTLGEYASADDLQAMISEVTGSAVISAGVERSDWEAGIPKVDEGNFTLANTTGRFDDGIGRGNKAPFFAAAGRANALVRAGWGAVELFEGDVSAATGDDDYFGNTAKLTALSLINRLRAVQVAAGRVRLGMTASEALRALTDDAASVGITAGAVDLPSGIAGVSIIGVPEWFAGRSVYDAINSVCGAAGAVAIVGADSALNFRTIAKGYGDEIAGTAPARVRVENGARRAANVITLRRAADDGIGAVEFMQTARHNPSVQIYGEQNVTIQAPWLDETASAALLNSLLELRAVPRDIMTADFLIGDELPVSALALLRKVRITRSAEYEGEPPSLSGGVEWGAAWADERARGGEFAGVVLRYRFDLRTGVANITLAL